MFTRKLSYRKLLLISYALITTPAFGLSIVPHIPSLVQHHDTVVPAFLHQANLISSSIQSDLGNHHQNPGINLFSMYKHELAAKPLETKMMTGAALALAGDALAQLKDSDIEYDVRRASSFILFDVLYRVLQHYSFPLITENCKGQFLLSALHASPIDPSFVDHLSPTIIASAEQSIVCQFSIVPFIYYPVFFALTAFVQGLSMENAVDRAKQTFLPIMARNLMFWIPVQTIVFGFVEEDLQIPLLCLTGLVWTIILSLVAGSTKKYSSQEQEILVRDMYDTLDDTAIVESALSDRSTSAKETVTMK